MSEDQHDSIRLLSSVIGAICLMILVPLNAWGLAKIVDISERTSQLETFVDSFVREGPRFTSLDFEREQSITMRIIEGMGRTLDDHEGRLRIVENKSYQK